jgi:hypothetical protein
MRSTSLVLAVVAVPVAPVAVVAVVAIVAVVSLAAACDEPPITLGLSAEEHEPYFPITAVSKHALGAASPDGQPISCDSCHKGRESFKEALCFSCHQFDAVPLTTVHGGIAGYEPVDASCLECHARGDVGTIEGTGTHSELWFPIDPDDAHGGPAYLARVGAGSTCTACHASVEDRSLPLCVECHLQDATPLVTAHALLASSYAQRDIACKECHAEIPINAAVRPVTKHDDEIFLTDHHEARCADCHAARRPAPQEWGIDFATASCVRCHVEACTPDAQAACFP